MIVLVFETIFCLFFKKMPETKIFRGGTHGPPYTTY